MLPFFNAKTCHRLSRKLCQKCQQLLLLSFMFLSSSFLRHCSASQHHHHQSTAWNSLFRDGHGDIAALWPIHNQQQQQQQQQKSGHSLMRNALRPDSKSRWTEYRDRWGRYVIPYKIVGQFLPDDYRRIMEAMAGVAKNSCVRFRRKRWSEEHFLQIRNDRGQGCYSSAVGRLPLGGNIINLETNERIKCASQLGLVLHELFHIAGLWHEHQRWDRRRYIRIHKRYVLPDTEVQLMKVPLELATYYGVPYDYRSVMHYPKDAFARFQGTVVLETRDSDFQDIIGHAENASPSDYLKVCAIYACRRCMGRRFRLMSHLRRRHHRWRVREATEADIRRQQQGTEPGQDLDWQEEEEGSNGAMESQPDHCRCHWDGCWCRMDDRWQWRAFDSPFSN